MEVHIVKHMRLERVNHLYSYNYDIAAYIQQLHQFIENQNKRMNRLEQKLMNLQKELEEVKNRPTTNIDRIEYKFDQLKVETLEGTLNIGLNPLNGEQIEDFSVAQSKMNIPDVRHVHNDILNEIETEIDTFLSNECHSFIDTIEKNERYTLAEGYRDFIIEDIRKQISDRIIYYVGQHQAELQNPLQIANGTQTITNKVKTDIQNSITAFMKNIPNNMKVGKE